MFSNLKVNKFVYHFLILLLNDVIIQGHRDLLGETMPQTVGRQWGRDPGNNFFF